MEKMYGPARSPLAPILPKIWLQISGGKTRSLNVASLQCLVWRGAAQRCAAQSQRGGDVEAGDLTRLTQFTATWRKTSMTVLHQSQLIGDDFCTKVYYFLKQA